MVERNVDHIRNLTSFSSSDICIGIYAFTESVLYFTYVTLSSDNNELSPSLLN